MSKRRDDAPSDLVDFLVGLFAVGVVLLAAGSLIVLAVGSS